MKTMKTKGYKKGGLKMVKKDGKMVPFYAADGIGKMADGGEVEMPPGVGNMPLTDKQAEEAIRILKERERKKKENKKKPVNKKGGGMMKTKGYATGGKVPSGKKRTPEEQRDHDMQVANLEVILREIDKAEQKKKKNPPVKRRGGGMMKTKGYKRGGAMKTKGYSKGGKVRGAGIARKGVRPCKMR